MNKNKNFTFVNDYTSAIIIISAIDEIDALEILKELVVFEDDWEPDFNN